MRVVLISKAQVVGAYQRKLEEIAACPGIELTAVVPPAWRDERGLVRLERSHLRGYRLAVEPLAFNGSFHLHFYPRLGRLLSEVRPDIVHLDEEPYNFATWHAQTLALRCGAQTVFFSWQNLLRRYPWPFSRFERQVLRRARAAIAGSRGVYDVWRAKGFAGPMRVIPQFGVDPEIFSPAPGAQAGGAAGPLVVGYAGRLVEEKGVDLLLHAAAQAPVAEVRLAGAGPALPRLQRQASELRLSERLSVQPLLPSGDMPGFYRQLDCLVLASRTRPNWKEQFGRVLVEAMACGVPVVGANSGEIPNVIGEAGLVFAEGDAAALAAHLRALAEQPGLRQELAARGRARVLAHYTQQQVARQTVEVWQAMRAQPS
jgi:glycosyltransferase involved in cell wall biosynthesis